MSLLESVLGQLMGAAQGTGAQQQGQPGAAGGDPLGGLGSLLGGGGGGQAGGAALITSLIAALLAGQSGGASASAAPAGGLGGLGGGLGGVLGSLLGGATGGGGGAAGGLGGLLEKLQGAGLGDAAGSWVSSGPNQHVSGEQLESAFGSDIFSRIGSQFGVEPREAASQLSQVLPGVIDRLTPGGQLPGGDLSDIGALLGKLGGR